MKKIDGRTMFAPTDLRGKRHNNNVNRLHKRQSKKQRYRYRKGQTKAFASPRRTARETSDSAGRVEQVFPRAVFPGTTGRCGLLSLGKPAVAISAGRRAGHRPLQIYLFMKDKTTPLPCRASRTERSPLSPTVTFPHPVGNHPFQGRQSTPLPYHALSSPYNNSGRISAAADFYCNVCTLLRRFVRRSLCAGL